MLARIQRWFTPPIFPANPSMTRRADFLNIALLVTLCSIPVIIAGNLLGGHTPALTLALDLGAILTTLGVGYVLRRGHVTAAAVTTLILSLIIVTLAVASLGTIRTPTTTLYLVVIILAGVLFDLAGSILFTALSSLAVLGLAAAEASGRLPRPDYAVTLTQWVTYSILFACISLFSYFALRRTQQALSQADRELAERQRTERALRLREEQLHEAQQLARLGSWDWDLQTQVLSWSDEVYRIFGVTPSDFAPSTEAFESFIHPDDRDDFLRRRAQLLAETHTAIIDHRIIRRDGGVRWVQERAQVLVDEHGQTYRVTGTVQDITERQHIEEALRESEAKYRRMVETAGEGIWTIDAAGRTDFINARGADILGYQVTEMVGRSPEDFVFPEDAAYSRQEWQKNHLGDSVSAQYRMRHQHGHAVWVQANTTPIYTRDEQRPIGALAMFTDITERKQMEDALRQSEQRYRDVSMLITDFAFGFHVTPDQTLVKEFATGALDQIIDTVSHSQNPLGLLGLIAPEDQSATESLVKAIIGGERLVPFEFRVNYQASLHWVQGNLRIEWDETAHRIVRIIGAGRNISERKQMEEALRQSEARFRAALKDLPLVVFNQDRDLRYTWIANPHPGLFNAGVLGKTDADLLPPDDASRLTDLKQQVLDTGLGVRAEARTTIDGQAYYYDLSVEPLRDATERVVGVTCASLDITARKRAEAALRESQQIIAGILNAVPARVFWKDKNLVYLGCNAAFARDAGFTDPADIIGKDDYQLGWRNQAERYRNDDRHVIDSGSAKSLIEEPQTTPAGETITLLTSKAPLRDAQGAICGVLGTYVDISDRKQAAEAEHEQRALAEALRDSAAALNSTLALNEVLDQIMASVERIVPNEAANIMLIDAGVARIVRNRGFAERGVEQYIATVRFQVNTVANMRTMIETGQALAIPSVRNYPGWVDTPESHWVASHIGAPLRLKGRVIGFLNLDTAIPNYYTPLHAERLQAFADQAATAIENARLLEAEHTQRLLAEALRDTAAALNSTLDLDEVFERILANVERVVDHDTANLMLINEHGIARIVRHRGYVERGLVAFAEQVRLTVAHVPNLLHMARTGQPRVMPNVQTEPDWIDWPESHWIQSIASAPICLKDTTIGFINLNSGTPGFYSVEHGERLQAFANQVAVAVENARLYDQIHQHSQLLEARVADRTAELRAANLRLTELDHLKDEFLSRISHELRTPLSGILISLELLEMSQPEKRARYMLRVKQAAERLRDMIEDVLMFSQLNLYTQPDVLEPIDLNNLIEGRVTTWQTLSTAHQLSLQLDLAADLPRTRTDGELIAHALTRLITNAINYTPTGSVTISTVPVTEPEHNWVTVRITDTGPGIPPDELPHIFERFYRGRAAADYKTPGTGIGLSISREIAEKLGGRLTVETQVDAGSTFILWLPAAT